MKNARDILVAGIGFLFGMVFCYFVLAAKMGRERQAGIWAVIGPTTAATNTSTGTMIQLNWN